MLHVEFQSTKDEHIGPRLLEYNVLAARDHKQENKVRKPVLSCVFYLRKAEKLPTSPLIEQLPNGQVNLIFHYKIVRLWEIPSKDLLESGLLGLLPLVPLTEQGKKHTTIEKMLAQLQTEEVQPLMILNSYMIASLALGENESEQQWLRGSFKMFSDILEEIPAYRDIIDKGRVEGYAEMLVKIVEARFPALTELASHTAETIEQTEVLSDLLVQVSVAPNEHEVRRLLLQHDPTIS